MASAVKCACGAAPTKGMQSKVKNFYHVVCDDCGEQEYQDSLAMGRQDHRLIEAKRKHALGESKMTFTLRKMSGKGIRMVARYLAVLKLGGELNDTPEQFYERFEEQTRQSRRECEQAFTACTDDFEVRLHEEDGFMSSHRVQEVAASVEKKLKWGMWIEGEVAADHQKNGVAKPKPSAVVSARDVDALIGQLKKAADPETRRKLRRQLRKLGHRGGAR